MTMPETSTLDLEGRIALVTGASRGLGAAVAMALAARGAHVVVTARTVGGLEALDDRISATGQKATLLPLDLIEGDQLDTLGPSLLQRFGRLDIMVHCAAALGKLTPVAHIMPKDWNTIVAVNLSAGWRLIRSCGPLLQNAPDGRAVFVTCDAARTQTPYWGALAATKAGLEQLVLSWAAETGAISPLRTNLFDPGPMPTRLRRDAFPGEDQAILPTTDIVASQLVTLCLPNETRHGQSIGFTAA
jgi:NAD(P)-dependent dehydrogenase (short-subunit alcohol dehydrogenase family)